MIGKVLLIAAGPVQRRQRLMPVKPIEFLGDSLRSPREFPDDAKRDIDLTKQRFALLSRK